MLKRRIATCLLFNDGVLFRTKKFVPDYRYCQTHLGTEVADEVFAIDITRSGPSKASHRAMEAFAERCYCPVAMGGWIRSIEDILFFLSIGTDNIVIGRAARQDPSLITRIAEKFGRQICVVACDIGPDLNTDAAVEWAVEAERRGAGEIFVQSVERDGSLSGYDLDAVRRISAVVKCHVAVGTSCGSARHMHDAFDAGATLAATSNIFHLTDAGMRGFKQYFSNVKNPDGSPMVRPVGQRIAAAGVEVRV